MIKPETIQSTGIQLSIDSKHGNKGHQPEVQGLSVDNIQTSWCDCSCYSTHYTSFPRIVLTYDDEPAYEEADVGIVVVALLAGGV